MLALSPLRATIVASLVLALPVEAVADAPVTALVVDPVAGEDARPAPPDGAKIDADGEARGGEETTLAAAPPPAPLPPAPAADLRFSRVEPMELLVSGLLASAGCAAAAVPLGACGAMSAVLGVSGIVGVLGAGLPAGFAVLGAISAFCVSVPVFFAVGPVTSQTAFVGAVNGLSLVDDDVPVVPMLVAALPSLGLALLGSTLAFVGTTMLTTTALAVDPEGMQASTVLIAAGLVTAALSGPVAVLSTVAAGQIFASPDDEGPAVVEREDRARPIDTPVRAAQHTRY